jgi:hypothetical protein
MGFVPGLRASCFLGIYGASLIVRRNPGPPSVNSGWLHQLLSKHHTPVIYTEPRAHRPQAFGTAPHPPAACSQVIIVFTAQTGRKAAIFFPILGLCLMISLLPG